MYLFMEDICGESQPTPRHGRAIGDLASLRKQIEAARIRALTAFREAAMEGSFPGPAETAKISSTELNELKEHMRNHVDPLLEKYGEPGWIRKRPATATLGEFQPKQVPDGDQ